jgi:hypothetical protein
MDWGIIVQGIILFSGVIAVLVWLLTNFFKKRD